MPTLRAARLFDAEVNEANTKLRFTRASAHPNIAIDWHNMTCIRLEALVDGPQAPITITYKPETRDSKFEPNWSIDAGGAVVRIRRGRKVYFNQGIDTPNFKLDPGAYTATATAGGVSVSKTFDIKQGLIAKIAIAPAAIRLVGVPDSDKNKLEVRLHHAGDRSTLLATFRPGKVAPVMPGIYDLELTTQIYGSVWITNIELRPGQRLDVKTRTATLIIESTPAHKLRILRADAKNWIPFTGGNGRTGPLPPGAYDISWEEGGRRQSRTVTLKPGEEKRIRLQ